MSDAVKLPGQSRLRQWGIVVVLTVIVILAAAPSYLSGQWPWSNPPEAPNIEGLRALVEEPLRLPGWEPSFQRVVNISGSKWNLAEYRAADGQPIDDVSNFALLLLPQPWHSNQPEVEWVDITGVQGWRVDDLHSLRFSVRSPNQGAETTVTARFFRGIDEQQTFAVAQWYAWPTGGHAAPGRWFWADQLRQWRRQERMPWVAVSLLLPIEPVGDIRAYSETATVIGQTIQSSLVDSVFRGS